MDYKITAQNTFKKFSSIDGNQHIAGEYAIETVLKLIDDFRIKSVLELGLGIGSISDAVLNYSKKNNLGIKYFGTEANEFCLDSLKSNVEDYDNIKLFSNFSGINVSEKFDLIIVDGSDSSLNEIDKFCKKDTIIFIEGFRGVQVHTIKEIFPNYLHAEMISIYKNKIYSPFPADKWSCGGQLIFTNPSFKQKYYWFKEKVNTSLKYRLRKFKK